MTNAKTTKRALLSSVIALLLCCAMLVGTTFAWFTDSASTAVNKIQAGTLDVALEMKDAQGNWVPAENQTLSWVKAAGAAENEAVLWEPGCTYVLPELRVVNKGNLALKYKIIISGIVGDAKLLEAIDFTYGDNIDITAEVSLAPNAATEGIVIKGQMKADAGNEYQGLSIDGIGITVVATQVTAESDSFGNQYDKDATAVSVWDGSVDADGLAANTDDTAKTVEIKTAAQFAAFAQAVNSGNSYAGYTISLMVPIDLNNHVWTPVGGGTIDVYPGNTFKGTFNGNGLTISNLKVASTGYHATAALFGSANCAVIKNVVIDGASITSTHYAAGILGYDTEWTDISGCSVKNAVIVSSAENSTGSWDNGDKVGGIVGYINVAHIENCSVENTIVMGYRDIGGIAGYAGSGYIKECSVKSVSMLQDTTHDYKDPTPTTLGAIVGKYGALTLSNNKETDVTVANGAPVAENVSTAMATGGNLVVTSADNTLTFGNNTSVASDVSVNLAGTTQEIANSIKAESGQNISMSNGELVKSGTFGKIRMDTVSGEQVCVFENMTFTDTEAPSHTGSASNDTEEMIQICPRTGTGKYVFRNCTFNNAKVTIAGLSSSTGNIEVVFEGCTFNNTGNADAIEINSNYLTGSLTIKDCTFNLVTTSNISAIDHSGSKPFTVNIDTITVNGSVADSSIYHLFGSTSVKAYSVGSVCTVTANNVTVTGIATEN